MVYNNGPGDRVFVSWSGGKDAYLSLLLAKERGLEIDCLLSFVSSDGYSRSHGLKTEILECQADALGLELETAVVTWESYEEGFAMAVKSLKEERGITGGVFGDVNLSGHREWIEKMASRCEIGYNLPLWMMEEKAVTQELIKRGGKALIVAIRSDIVDEKWLGRVIDDTYVDYCLNKGISPCGEAGEAHTLVIGGPLFKKPLRYNLGYVKRNENRTLVEISTG